MLIHRSPVLTVIAVAMLTQTVNGQSRQSITFGGLKPQNVQRTYSPNLGPTSKVQQNNVGIQRNIGAIPQSPNFGNLNPRARIDVMSPGRSKLGMPQPNRPQTRPSPRPNNNIVIDQSSNQTNITNNVVNNTVNNNVINNNVINNNYGGYPGYGVNYPAATISVSPGRNWGPGYNRWQNQWYQSFVHSRHHDWYHGSWNGNGHRRWYTPLTFGISNGWGRSAIYESGYVQYSNPYLISGVTIAGWDYSRPVAIQTFSQGQDSLPQEGFDTLDHARTAFRNRQYSTATKLTERALGERIQDPVAHEFYALCLFADGEYAPAALVLNSLLASAPGWDWTTMIGLYGSRSPYEAHLRRLERYVQAKPEDAAARFLLAYHYLVCGRAPAAIEQLERVVALKPRDMVATRMLASLKDPENLDDADRDATPPQQDRPQTDAPIDLVGTWQAKRQGETFLLDIDKDGTFIWKHDASRTNSTLQGTVSVVNGIMILENPQGTTMVGRMTPIDKDQFHFTLLGGTGQDEGLLFRR